MEICKEAQALDKLLGVALKLASTPALTATGDNQSNADIKADTETQKLAPHTGQSSQLVFGAMHSFFGQMREAL